MANPQMLTANRLRDGDVVYWRAGGWVEAFGLGEVFSAEAEAEAALEAAQKSVAGNVVVNPYLFEVHDETDGVHPVKEREIVRALGPSVGRTWENGQRHLTPLESIRRSEAKTDRVTYDLSHPARCAPRPPHKGTVKSDDDVSI